MKWTLVSDGHQFHIYEGSSRGFGNIVGMYNNYDATIKARIEMISGTVEDATEEPESTVSAIQKKINNSIAQFCSKYGNVVRPMEVEAYQKLAAFIREKYAETAVAYQLYSFIISDTNIASLEDESMAMEVKALRMDCAGEAVLHYYPNTHESCHQYIVKLDKKYCNLLKSKKSKAEKSKKDPPKFTQKSKKTLAAEEKEAAEALRSLMMTDTPTVNENVPRRCDSRHTSRSHSRASSVEGDRSIDSDQTRASVYSQRLSPFGESGAISPANTELSSHLTPRRDDSIENNDLLNNTQPMDNSTRIERSSAHVKPVLLSQPIMADTVVTSNSTSTTNSSMETDDPTTSRKPVKSNTHEAKPVLHSESTFEKEPTNPLGRITSYFKKMKPLASSTPKCAPDTPIYSSANETIDSGISIRTPEPTSPPIISGQISPIVNGSPTEAINQNLPPIAPQPEVNTVNNGKPKEKAKVTMPVVPPINIPPIKIRIPRSTITIVKETDSFLKNFPEEDTRKDGQRPTRKAKTTANLHLAQDAEVTPVRRSARRPQKRRYFSSRSRSPSHMSTPPKTRRRRTRKQTPNTDSPKKPRGRPSRNPKPKRVYPEPWASARHGGAMTRSRAASVASGCSSRASSMSRPPSRNSVFSVMGDSRFVSTPSSPVKNVFKRGRTYRSVTPKHDVDDEVTSTSKDSPSNNTNSDKRVWMFNKSKSSKQTITLINLIDDDVITID